MTDNGIGIKAENIKDLGRYGFREARQKVEGSHGFGIASIISNLREMGWGPLWVKSEEDKGAEFRFTIPAQAIRQGGADAEISSVNDSMGMGPKTSFERNLRDGFIVLEASMDPATQQLLQEIPKGPEQSPRPKP